MSGSPSDRAYAHPFLAIHADAWAEPIDVPSLNRDVSDLLLQRIEQVRSAGEAIRTPGDSTAKTGALRSTSVLLLGIAGSGKTHLFARLRRQAGRRAVFVLNRPEIGASPTPRHVLAAIVDSLRHPVSGEGHKQIDVIAGAMLAAIEQMGTRYPFLALDDCTRRPREEQRAMIERAVAETEDSFPEIWPQYLERLLSLPFESRQTQRALFAWLSGREPSPAEIERLGGGGGLADNEVMPALRTLGVAAAFGAPIVLVFDQLENLAEDSGKNERILAHARLVSELRDTVRGLVIVQMALDSEWLTRIRPVLHGSDRARLEETIKMLSLPTPAERRALIESWREALPEAERAGPFPSPFSAADVAAWTQSPGMTPRMLMQACGEAYVRSLAPAPAEGEAAAATVTAAAAAAATAAATTAAEGAAPRSRGAELDERLQMQWEQAIERARCEIDEASQQAHGVSALRIAGGFFAAFGLLGVTADRPDAKTEHLLRVELPPDAEAPAPAPEAPAPAPEAPAPAPEARSAAAKTPSPARAAKSAKEAPPKALTRYVLIAQHPHPRSLAAALRMVKALCSARPVILVRERALAIPPTWKEVEQLLAGLTNTKTPGAAVMLIERADMARLLALADFMTAARSQDLSWSDGSSIPGNEALRWMQTHIDCSSWGPIRAALEAPRATPVAAAQAAHPISSAATPLTAPPAQAAHPISSAAITPTPPSAAPRAPATRPSSSNSSQLSQLSPENKRRSDTDAPGVVRAVLERLRIASVERIVREVKAVDKAATRATVTRELRQMPVKVFGDAIVVLEER
jgi:hypothetical protein